MLDTEARFAITCSYLGLTASDMAELGDFSERFARDLLAGRRPFPKHLKDKIRILRREVYKLHQAMYEEISAGNEIIYIYRTKSQLRRSPFGKIWHNACLGPYRVAAFEVMERCYREGREIQLMFAEAPASEDESDA